MLLPNRSRYSRSSQTGAGIHAPPYKGAGIHAPPIQEPVLMLLTYKSQYSCSSHTGVVINVPPFLCLSCLKQSFFLNLFQSSCDLNWSVDFPHSWSCQYTSFTAGLVCTLPSQLVLSVCTLPSQLVLSAHFPHSWSCLYVHFPYSWYCMQNTHKVCPFSNSIKSIVVDTIVFPITSNKYSQGANLLVYSKRKLTYFVRGSITVKLTCLASLD